MQLVSHRLFKPNPLLPTLGLAFLTALLWAVLLAGRSLPWQADRAWAYTFALAFVLAVAWWWHLLQGIQRIALGDELTSLQTVAWTVVPFLALATVALMAIYLLDPVNHFATIRSRVESIACAVLLTLLPALLQQASILRLEHRASGIWDAIRIVLSRYSGMAAWGSLAFIGLLQAASGTDPVGDDIWHFSMVSDAILEGRPYPVPTVDPDLQEAGMGSTYPALPLMPSLLAISFSLFGRNLVGVAMPTILATALFPVLMYAVCRRLTRNTLVAYSVTLLLYLFPIYQIHILNTPQPDTIFVVILLTTALLSIRANESMRTRYWIGMGLAIGLASLTRPEGVYYAAALFLTFLVFHHRRIGYWLAAATWLAVLAPFSLLYRSLTGDLWPRTLGAKMLGWENLEANLAALQWPALEWYREAIGVGTEALMAGLLAILLLAAVGALALLRDNPPLAWIPAAGIGNVLAGFVTNPRVMSPDSPVEFLRHDSFGIPFLVVSVAYGVFACARPISRLPRRWGRLLLVAALLLVASAFYYDAEHLARPEPYFEGSTSLLWTGNGYLLSDLWSHPVPLPASNDLRSGEEVRADLRRPLEDFSLRLANHSEPYHRATLLVALFGLAYLAMSVRGAASPLPQSAGPGPLRTAFGQPASSPF